MMGPHPCVRVQLNAYTANYIIQSYLKHKDSLEYAPNPRSSRQNGANEARSGTLPSLFEFYQSHLYRDISGPKGLTFALRTNDSTQLAVSGVSEHAERATIFDAFC